MGSKGTVLGRTEYKRFLDFLQVMIDDAKANFLHCNGWQDVCVKDSHVKAFGKLIDGETFITNADRAIQIEIDNFGQE